MLGLQVRALPGVPTQERGMVYARQGREMVCATLKYVLKDEKFDYDIVVTSENEMFEALMCNRIDLVVAEFSVMGTEENLIFSDAIAGDAATKYVKPSLRGN